MNLRSVEVIQNIYKPTKVTILGNVEILESTSGNVVIKEKQKDIRKLYDYLNQRSFSYFPSLIDDSREGINVFEFVPDTQMPKEQKAQDLMKIIGLLHQKTTYYKEVCQDEYQQIYEEVKEQIDYLNYFYEDMYQIAFRSVFPSPSEYFLSAHISKILASLSFASEELEKWYQKVSSFHRFRVCQIHNHLCLDHFHECEKSCLLSWEESRKDSPVMDLFQFYKEEYFDLPFQQLLEQYFRVCPWSEEERQLFFVVISIPPKFEKKYSEFDQVNEIRKVLDYVYKTEELIRPYYAVEQKQENKNFNE